MPTLTDPAVLTLARHYAELGGWLHVVTTDTLYPRANAVLVAAGYVTAGERGRSRTYELTPAGRAWLATQEKS